MWYKVKRIMVWDKQVRPAGWTPDASRTLLYLPLESNATDYSGNNRTTSATSVTYTTVGWVQSAHVWTTWWIIVSPNDFISHSLNYKTNSVLVYVTSATSSSRRVIFECAKQNYYHFWWMLSENSTNIQFWSNWCGSNTVSWTVANSWLHLVQTIWDGYIKFYINWTLVDTQTYSTWYAWWNRSNSIEQNMTIFNDRGWVSDSRWLQWNARELIFENILWSAEDVSKYYNRIKGKLGF